MTMDPERFAYLKAGNDAQARKRVAADVLIRDAQGRVLLVNPSYKPNWDLPGGMVEADEAPIAAATRELAEELGLHVPIARLLYVEWVPPHGPWDDMIEFIFDGGVVTQDQLDGIRIGDGELLGYEMVSVNDARARLRPYVHERLTIAISALEGGTIYVESHRPDLGETVG